MIEYELTMEMPERGGQKEQKRRMGPLGRLAGMNNALAVLHDHKDPRAILCFTIPADMHYARLEAAVHTYADRRNLRVWTRKRGNFLFVGRTTTEKVTINYELIVCEKCRMLSALVRDFTRRANEIIGRNQSGCQKD